jgi:hypothetical protein
VTLLEQYCETVAVLLRQLLGQCSTAGSLTKEMQASAK